jgi:probable addiction module antidote protein
MRKATSTTSSAARPSHRRAAEPSLPYESWLIQRLHDPAEAAAYLEAAIEQGHPGALMLALRHVAMAQGGIAAVAKRARLTREAAYRILSPSGNPELRSLSAILEAAGLRLSVKPIAKRSGVAQKRADYRRTKRSGTKRPHRVGASTRAAGPR